MENILVGLFGWAITFPALNMGHQVDISGMQVYTRSGSNKGFPGGSAEKSMAPHSSTLAWKIPWTEEPGGLQSLGSRRVGHDWATSLSLFTFMHWRRKWQPTPVFLPGKIPGTGEPGGLPSMGSHRVGHDWSDLAAAAAGGSDGKESACDAEDLGSIHGSGRSPGEGNANPLQYSCLGNPMDRGAWQAVIHVVTKSHTQLND